jgi:small-conductance mechanosensitive channel
MPSGSAKFPMSAGSETEVLAKLSLAKVLFAAALIVGAWILLKWLRGVLDRLEKHNPRLRFLLRQIEPPLRIAIWFAAILISAEILAPSQNAFLAALGSAALAIGLGLQDLIKNLIGGMVIVVDRPFQTGDRIRLGDAYGEVRQIGLRSTKIRTDDGVLVTIPNSDILTKFIFNVNSGVAESVVSTDVAFPSDADADEVLTICREVAVCCPYTHLGMEIDVSLQEDDRRSHMSMVTIQAYVYDHRFESAMQTDLLRHARRELQSHGILKGPDGSA